MLLSDSDSDDELELLAIAALEQDPLSHPRPHGGSTPGHRFIWRDRGTAHILLFSAYFSQSPLHDPSHFRSRFRMSQPLFRRILEAVESRDPYFVQRRDAAGVSGLSPFQKVTASLRVLTDGAPLDSFESSLGMGVSTVLESFKRFVKSLIAAFGDRYLRRPNEADVVRLLAEGERRGFPGMIGSIDCMHWRWKNCPVKWKQKFGVGDYEPAVIFEGVASYDLWIWSAYFAMPWGHNEIHVPDPSLVSDLANGVAAPASYTINGRGYTMGYYLVNDVYPSWSTVVKTISGAKDNKEMHFVARHESAVKDVERAFEVLQSRFAILRGPIRFWQREALKDLIKSCIIMHNMIVEDERDDRNSDFNYDEVAGDRTITSTREHTKEFMEFLERYNSTITSGTRSQLQTDLVDHLRDI